MILAEFWGDGKRGEGKMRWSVWSLGAELGDTVAHLVEVVKLYSSDCTAYTRGNGLASITNKVRDGKYLGGFLAVGLVFDLKVPEERGALLKATSLCSTSQLTCLPVVRELELEACVVGGFHGDNVGAEVRPQEKAERAYLIGPLGLPA